MYYTDERYEREQAARKAMFQRAQYDEWLKLRKSERKLFMAVVKAWRKHNSEGRWNHQQDELHDWVTREQIADELGSFRLIPYYIKLLEHLSGGKSSRDYHALHWIQKAKRTRWRHTYEGIKRPAGYEWVYQPSQDVIDALNEMNPNNAKREVARSAVPALPPAPKYRPPLWERVIDKMLDLLP